MDMNTKQTCGPVENGLVFNLSGKVGRANFWCKFQRGVKWTDIIPNYLTTELTNVLKKEQEGNSTYSFTFTSKLPIDIQIECERCKCSEENKTNLLITTQ